MLQNKPQVYIKWNKVFGERNANTQTILSSFYPKIDNSETQGGIAYSWSSVFWAVLYGGIKKMQTFYYAKFWLQDNAMYNATFNLILAIITFA